MSRLQTASGKRSHRVSPWLLCLALLAPACASDEPAGDDDDSSVGGDDDDTVTGDDDDSASGDDDDSATYGPCSPALSLSPESGFANPYDLITLDASGGTGAYRFALEDAPSGAILNDWTGAYLAGAEIDVTDRVILTDEGCEGNAEASIQVVSEMTVLPTAIELLPGTTFTFETSAGSGQVTCLLKSASPMGSMSGCTYTAGEAEGIDWVTVTDPETSQTVDSWITISSDASLSPDPPHIVIPLGSSYVLRIDGGSGVFDLSTESGTSVTATGDLLEASEPGQSDFLVSDRFAGLSTEIQVHVVAPLEVEVERMGDQTTSGLLVAPGDVNGDGYEDLLFGLLEADVDAANGGAVFLWAGNGSGFDLSPARTWAGTSWDEYLGRGMTVGDFNGDGLSDLAIGAPQNDSACSDCGEIAVYSGESGAYFASESSQVMHGNNNGDRLGQSLTACDFNGDGFDDLVAGAIRDEDRSVEEQSNDQGALHLFLGGTDGLQQTADQILWGVSPGAEGFAYTASLYMGFTVASGDVNGDGFCDLLGAGVEWDGLSGDAGAVLLYLGDSSGLQPSPVRAWAGHEETSTGGNLGREMAVADANGDGYEDILLGHRLHDVEEISGNNHGAVRLFLGSADIGISPPTDWELPSSADWSYEGNSGWDYLGQGLDLADTNGDGIADIIVGAPADEIEGGSGGAGVLRLFHGVENGLPGTEPDFEWSGLDSSDFFGASVTSMGDVDGDGSVDLSIWASRQDSQGTDIGTPYIVFGDTAIGWQSLIFPGEPAGFYIGEDVQFLDDIDGDGLPELALGAPYYRNADLGSRQGLVAAYAATTAGTWSTSPQLYLNYPSHSGWDMAGAGVSSLGDFDGDGSSDFAILARGEDRPNTFDSEIYANPEECPGSLNNAGGVYIFSGLNGDLPGLDPSFVYYGPDVDQAARFIRGDVDFNGDGLKDLILGSYSADPNGRSNAGRVEVVFGRNSTSELIEVICSSDWSYDGLNANDYLGRSVTGLGDIDQPPDGCDEIAVGTEQEDLQELNNQGSVRIFFGQGSSCDPDPRMLVLVPQDQNARAGISVDGGTDIDGDGINELAVGAWDVEVGADDVGAAWLVLGSYLSSLVPEAVVEDTPISPYPFSDSFANLRVEGEDHDEQFGRSVALVPAFGDEPLGGLFVGGPLGSRSGGTRTGGARLHLYDTSLDPPALQEVPALVVGGESDQPECRIGERIDATLIEGVPYGIIGGYRGSALGTQTGSAYAFPLDF